MSYIHRSIEKQMVKLLKSFPVIGLTGARQVGKSTMLRNILPDYRYITFDDSRVVNFFIDDPVGFFDTYNNKIIFDEVQKVPEIFNWIKLNVDNDRDNYGKFIITGSSQFSLISKIRESLAGRIGLLSLYPLQFSELPDNKKDCSIITSRYPELILRDFNESSNWYASYLETYIEKDLRSIKDIGNLHDFRRFIYLLAANVANQCNMSELSKKIGISVPTVKSWLSVLEASYLIYLLPPYFENYGKRIVKSPKIYFYDTGLVCFLLGIDSDKQYNLGSQGGAIFENYVISEIRKLYLHNNKHFDFYYLRTSAGDEIDLIVDKKSSKDFIEIKKTSTFNHKMLGFIDKVITNGNKGYLLYNGPQQDYKNFNVINYKDYLILNACAVKF